MWTKLEPELLKHLPKKPLNGSNCPPQSWADVHKDLEKFRNEYTVDGWDGQGAEAIPIEVFESAEYLATELEARGVEAPFWAGPTFNSSIAFEWDGPDGRTEVELEITGPSSLTISKRPSNGPYESFAVTDGVAVA